MFHIFQFGRWSLLTAGILYGVYHQNRLSKKEAIIRKIEAEKKVIRDAQLAIERKKRYEGIFYIQNVQNRNVKNRNSLLLVIISIIQKEVYSSAAKKNYNVKFFKKGFWITGWSNKFAVKERSILHVKLYLHLVPCVILKCLEIIKNSVLIMITIFFCDKNLKMDL